MPGLVFVICYDAARNYEDQALALARGLYEVYDSGIDALTLKPTEGDDLTLAVNGRILRSLRRDGSAPTVAHARAALDPQMVGRTATMARVHAHDWR